MSRVPLSTAVLLFLLPVAAHAARPATAGPPADTLYMRQDWAGAAGAYDHLVKAEPANGRAWYRLGVSLQQSGHADRAIPAYQKAGALGFAPQSTWYNLACAYAVTHDTEHAFGALDSLTNHGYRQPQALEGEGDFASIRSDTLFAAVVAWNLAALIAGPGRTL